MASIALIDEALTDNSTESSSQVGFGLKSDSWSHLGDNFDWMRAQLVEHRFQKLFLDV